MGTKWVLALAAAGVLAASAQAVSLPYSYSFDQSQYQVDPGALVVIPVYLQTNYTSAADDLVAENGLQSAGVLLTYQVGTQIEPAVITSNLILNTTDFGDTVLGPQTTLSPTSAGWVEYVEFGLDTGVVGSEVATGRRIYLGSFEIQAGNIIGEESFFGAGDFDAQDNTVTFANSLVLDSMIVPGSVSVLVIPEPTTLGLVAVGSVLALGRRK